MIQPPPALNRVKCSLRKKFKMSEPVVLRGISFPKMKGTLSKCYQLSKISWLKVGGPAEFLFKP